MEVLQYSPLAVRMFTAVSAGLYSLAGFTNLLHASHSVGYTAGIVSVYAIIFGAVAVMSEFSPYGLHLLMTAMPFLGEYRSRGILYCCVGLLLLGPEMQWFGWVGSILMIISGLFNILMHYLNPLQSASAYAGYDHPNTMSQQSLYRSYPEDVEGGGDYDQMRG
eukprot:GHVQ01023947.1.p1 GENE.GHVQ01023947.1~~GHVQ01023947.1.p1  ORF type:complete len:164 (-),score=5.65 GHVQ01023947.1:287-778(-)